jgi:MFS superfamily sulfate permease-like transporter
MEIATFRFSVTSDFVNGVVVGCCMVKSKNSFKKKVIRAIKFQAAPELKYQFPP